MLVDLTVPDGYSPAQNGGLVGGHYGDFRDSRWPRLKSRLLSPNLFSCRLIELAPLPKLFETELGQRIQKSPSGFLMPAGQTVIFIDHIGKPFGDGEAFVLSVRYRLQKSRPHILPVMLRDPAPLRAENALQNHTAVTGYQCLIKIEVPPGSGIKGIYDTLQAVRFEMHLSEPAAAGETAELPVLLCQYV